MSTKRAARERKIKRRYTKAEQEMYDALSATGVTAMSKKEEAQIMSVAVQSQQRKREELIDIYRSNFMRTVRDIRSGLVNEVDIDKLQNFLQTSLALMAMVPIQIFEDAKRNAEINSFLRESNVDNRVVLDPKKQPKIHDAALDMDAIIDEATKQMSDRGTLDTDSVSVLPQ